MQVVRVDKIWGEVQFYKTIICTAFQLSRDDWIRTSGPHVPNVVRYRAALHPEKSKINQHSFIEKIKS